MSVRYKGIWFDDGSRIRIEIERLSRSKKKSMSFYLSLSLLLTYLLANLSSINMYVQLPVHVPIGHVPDSHNQRFVHYPTTLTYVPTLPGHDTPVSPHSRNHGCTPNRVTLSHVRQNAPLRPPAHTRVHYTSPCNSPLSHSHTHLPHGYRTTLVRAEPVKVR